MNRIYGYCRVSTKKQNIERQVRNILEEYPNAIIRQEKYTGTKIYGRKELEKIINEVIPGDTIVFDSVSRMSRNADEGVKMYFNLCDKGVNLVFLKERHIDTDSYKKALEESGIYFESDGTLENNLVSDIIAAINRFMKAKATDDIRKAFYQAQKEVDDLHKRTSEGIETARRNGNPIGRQKGKTPNVKKNGEPSKQYLKEQELKKKIKKKSRDFDGTMTDVDCITVLHVSRVTYYKYKKELAEEIEGDIA